MSAAFGQRLECLDLLVLTSKQFLLITHVRRQRKQIIKNPHKVHPTNSPK